MGFLQTTQELGNRRLKRPETLHLDFGNGCDQNSARHSYDVRGRISGATLTHVDNGQTVVDETAYVYDDSGIRVRTTETRTVAGGTPTTNARWLLEDGNNPTRYVQVVEERLASGVLVASFVYLLNPASH